jgi:hypothetical protein
MRRGKELLVVARSLSARPTEVVGVTLYATEAGLVPVALSISYAIRVKPKILCGVL